MCVKKIYFNTYADGAQDVTEQVHACREGKTCLSPEIRTYERKLSFNKGDLDPEPPRRLRPSSYYLGGDLPTPRRSKSPSPAYRRESDAGLTDSPKPSKHHGYRDRHDHRESRRSRHADLDREPPSSPKLRRSNTNPHLVVIEQGAPVYSSSDVPPGPIHVAEEPSLNRRSSRRHRDRDADDLQFSRHASSSNPKAFVVVNDEREHRRRHRDHKRRMSSSSTSRPDPALVTPPAEEQSSSEPREPRRRYSLRRANTVVLPSSESSPPKHLRWEDELRSARARHNDEIANRKKPNEVHQDSRPKGILKPTAAPAAPSPPLRGKPLTRQDSELGGLRRAVENMDLPTASDSALDADELNLYDRDRLLARFGGSDGGERDRRRRKTKVWTGDRYQYL
ncbi:hypothetical protein B0T14DRAFT_564032 [Immersiella caudata]|uniref:Uncharacterized protein n=1 Tax=Immersiella caudata TaxID=314043 RepID=A0AA39WWB7_9PEZI|nr:hypothetical protein B0T14DRAFT_564032 [Immersiella caudata]